LIALSSFSAESHSLMTGLKRIVMLHCSTAYTDAAYCCRRSGSWSVGQSRLWALQKRWTDRDAIQNVEYGHRPKMGISIPPQDGTILRRKGMAHC